ncbi:MAG: sigma-70 family RNA polymerase sigma factor [Oscillospiraceae bacterium]|nr:sigma-70 family RNA polymerase sigma factor [Oscillospiraceae bacterium]
MLYRIALTYMHNREDAEDAVHDAFVTYIEKAPRFSDDTHERAWMVRVTINKCLDAKRRHKMRQYTPLEDVDVQSTAAVGDELPSELSDALGRLPDKLRIVTILHYFEGFSVREVAAMTSTTASAVKMRLSRAREMLKEALGGEAI